MLKNNLRIALLIDGDNAQAKLIPSILKTLDKHGTCVIRRVYGDWTAQHLSGWRELEQTHAIQLVQQSRYATGKNANDIAIVVAAMEILHSDKTDGFCIVSSDSDFTPLVIKLKDEGKAVIVAGKSTTPKSFVNACSLFITTDTLNPAPKKPVKVIAKVNISKVAQAKTASTKASGIKTSSDARPLLQKAYHMAPKKDEWVFLGALGHSLRQIDPGFESKTYGHKLLSSLVMQHRDIFEIKMEKGKGNTLSMYLKLKT